MTNAAARTMEPIYRRLRAQFDLPRKYVVETVLPEWWADEAASSPEGFAEVVILLSRHLGLDPRSLREEGELRPTKQLAVKLKRAGSSSGEDLIVAQRLAIQVARLAALAVTGPVAPLPTSGSEVREQILVEGAPWVGFESLLDYCWARGVAVLHVSNFPKSIKRMHGLAARVNGRPIIVLSWAKRHPAWLLFVLAHELGHLALGHVPEESTLVDEAVDQASQDDEEKQANAFALEVLNGSASTRFAAADRWPKAEGLATEARRIGKEKRIDPGHVVLNYANTMGRTFFAVANAALALLDGCDDASDLVRQRLAKHLDWERLPADSSEFVMRMTRLRNVSADPVAPALASES